MFIMMAKKTTHGKTGATIIVHLLVERVFLLKSAVLDCDASLLGPKIGGQGIIL